ncbi:MAG: Fe2+-dependent dioxygenase [Rheinheimera sp.]|uniref:Fe2+-dependent dioxygenase n=1 Tax=Arsukibacterium sp. UBA3155 TaxID=1946058 RepID=UPI000C91FDEE|nr:Fe2+-dependent dioxygenase [Arsukibacterium sp. UBA3155]MAD74703.1 Fe2+-dependent dioxygenase [Rheinheimera sp.]
MVVIKQLLSAAEVKEYRALLHVAPWNDGITTAMGMAASVKKNGQADAGDNQVQQLANRLLARLGHTPALLSAALPHRIFPPCFNCYGEGETYGLHVDAAIMRMPNNEILRSDLSMTTFLSEPDEYQGGELVIETEFGQQRVKLSAGDAVLYSSGSLHKVTPVTRGQRFAAITWIQSLIPDSQMRNTLHQLDQSIQNLLTNPAVAREQLDQLHHVYHNLIRQHSQV